MWNQSGWNVGCWVLIGKDNIFCSLYAGDCVAPTNCTIKINQCEISSAYVVVFLGIKWQDRWQILHYNDVIMSMMASQITGVFIVCSIVGSGADQRKYQSSASLAFVRGIHRWPVNSPHKGPVTRKMFPFDDVIMINPLQAVMDR